MFLEPADFRGYAAGGVLVKRLQPAQGRFRVDTDEVFLDAPDIYIPRRQPDARRVQVNLEERPGNPGFDMDLAGFDEARQDGDGPGRVTVPARTDVIGDLLDRRSFGLMEGRLAGLGGAAHGPFFAGVYVNWQEVPNFAKRFCNFRLT